MLSGRNRLVLLVTFIGMSYVSVQCYFLALFVTSRAAAATLLAGPRGVPRARGESVDSGSNGRSQWHEEYWGAC